MHSDTSPELLRRVRGITDWRQANLDQSGEAVVLAARLYSDAVSNEGLTRAIHQRRLEEAMVRGIIINGLVEGHGVEYFKSEDEIVERPSRAGEFSHDWERITPEEAERLRGQEATVVSLYVPSRRIADVDDISSPPLAQISFMVTVPGYPPTQYRAALQDLDWQPTPLSEEIPGAVQ